MELGGLTTINMLMGLGILSCVIQTHPINGLVSPSDQIVDIQLQIFISKF